MSGFQATEVETLSEMKEEDFEIMTKQEKSEYCIHSHSVQLLFDTTTCASHILDCDDTDEEGVNSTLNISV